ncbi:MAG: DUF6165 family protein [Chitinispirillales bacterium]|jgi:hypothetical protein|nr:DUF6165 family protein [Chitinispirillales bacterium]
MQIEISNGELVDKITILFIKLKMIKDQEKIQNIKREYDLLYPKMESLGITFTDVYFQELLRVNESLWEIEDKIREKESVKAFDDEFIHLARSVYVSNDKRAAIKKEINIKTNSSLVEEKGYSGY